MGDFPPWLRAHLEKRGLWNADAVGRAARARTCRRCGRTILVGLDGDLCADVALADPSPLSVLGEAAALVLGRRTYSLRWASSRLELDYRSSFHIRPHRDRLDVVAEHDCHSLPLPSLASVLSVASPARYDGDPPF